MTANRTHWITIRSGQAPDVTAVPSPLNAVSVKQRKEEIERGAHGVYS